MAGRRRARGLRALAVAERRIIRRFPRARSANSSAPAGPITAKSAESFTLEIINERSRSAKIAAAVRVSGSLEPPTKSDTICHRKYFSKLGPIPNGGLP